MGLIRYRQHRGGNIVGGKCKGFFNHPFLCAFKSFWALRIRAAASSSLSLGLPPILLVASSPAPTPSKDPDASSSASSCRYICVAAVVVAVGIVATTAPDVFFAAAAITGPPASRCGEVVEETPGEEGWVEDEEKNLLINDGLGPGRTPTAPPPPPPPGDPVDEEDISAPAAPASPLTACPFRRRIDQRPFSDDP